MCALQLVVLHSGLIMSQAYKTAQCGKVLLDNLKLKLVRTLVCETIAEQQSFSLYLMIY